MKLFLTAAEVAELADLLEDSPRRRGAVDEVLQAAAEGRGMTLELEQGFTDRKVTASKPAFPEASERHRCSEGPA